MMKMITRILPMLLVALPAAAQRMPSYDIAAPDATTTLFHSDVGQPGPQFRLTYELMAAAISGEFQARVPGRAEWRPYLELSESTPSTLETLAGIREAWIRDLRTKKLEPILKLYAPDAVFLQPTGERITGSAAIRSLFQTILATFNSDITLHSQNFETSGDLAYDSGDFQETLITIATGAKIASSGSYVIIFKRQSIGSWQIVQQVWTGTPPPGT
jgi:ketosteroid isomerase-like protein